MRQVEGTEPLAEVVGYALKQATTALRAAMDVALRPLELTVPQYACLELLGRHPGLSNAELARGAFVTRQSMNGVLRGLQRRGLVTRPVTASSGRARPTELTTEGRARLHEASAVVRVIEQRMLAPIGDPQRLRDELAACAAALSRTD